MNEILHIVTGAPGAGKSTALDAFIRLRSDYIALDIDWLADAASGLAQQNILVQPATWKPYAALWFAVLYAVYKNGRVPVFFSPNDPQDIEQYGRPAWCREIRWLLLDCDDQTRRARLKQRADWTEPMIEDAIADAQFLRGCIDVRIDTAAFTAEEVAGQILVWLTQSAATIDTNRE